MLHQDFSACVFHHACDTVVSKRFQTEPQAHAGLKRQLKKKMEDGHHCLARKQTKQTEPGSRSELSKKRKRWDCNMHSVFHL